MKDLYNHTSKVFWTGVATLLFMIINGFSFGQCPYGGVTSSAYDVSSLVDDTRTAMSLTLEGGEHIQLLNIVANKTYVLDVCSHPADTYLTLFDPSVTAIAFSDDDCGNDGKITFVAPVSGTYFIQLTFSGCNALAIPSTIYATRLSCEYPSSPAITVTQSVACFGDSAIFTLGGSLNDATHWILYKDSCGGEALDTTTTNSFTFYALLGTRKYFVRGEDGCTMDFGDCDSITLTTVLNDASFSYSSSNYCVSAVAITPTITGVAGGTFVSTTSGLTINGTTGEIDASTSTTGSYYVKYTTPGACPNSDSALITILPLDDVTFSYSAAAYCFNEANPAPFVTGVSGGTFVASPTGLIVNSNSGVIDIVGSTPATYSVTYSSSQTCFNSESHTVTINAMDNAVFSYSASAYCSDGADPSPTISGLPGGIFTTTAGIVMNSTSGQIDLSTSTASSYNINYTTAGICPNTNSFPLVINSTDNPNFDYGKTFFCTSESDPVPAIASSGGFTFSPVGMSINSTTGSIDISASTPAIYSLTYTTSGICPSSSNKNITISTLDNASFNYPSAGYCPLDTDPNATLTGVTGGVYSFSPFGLSIDASTGTVDLSASIPKPYSITYTTSGSCPNSVSQPLTINNSDDASYSYSNINFCITSSDPAATVTGMVGGIFSSSPPGLSVNNLTGLVDISSSSTGNYMVMYTTSGTCPNSISRTFNLTNSEDASFNYATPSFCAFQTNTTPTVTGNLGGTFSSTPGLTLSQNNGYINTGASNAGSYTVTYTTSGDCVNSSTQDVTIIAADDASFNYSAIEFCDLETDPIPNIVGDLGGTFSATPAGLIMNPITGIVDLSLSTPNLYTITYTTASNCTNSSTQSFIVKESSDAGFGYSSPSYCTTESDPSPVITGLTGGIFSFSPAGIDMDNYTGVIDLSASADGLYNIVYSVGGDCPNSETFVITLSDIDDASFSYNSTNYCTAGIDPSPIISGTPGGSFSATPAGLSINSSTGEIDLSASTLGNYDISYVTFGTCPNTMIQNITVSNFDDATFNYSSSAFCVTSPDPIPNVIGLLGGIFSASPVGMNINATNGTIDVSATPPGIYSVSYSTNGVCPNTQNLSITIQDLDDAGFTYSNSIYCITDIDPFPSFSGVNPGTFTSSPAGLIINTTTGSIDLDLSAPENYIITFTTSGPCPNSSSLSLEVKALDDANFTYGTNSFCASDADPLATLSGMSGGIFTSTPAGLSIDMTTGEIDIAASSFNTYAVTYTTTGPCPNTSSQPIQIVAFDDASFSYLANSYCLSNTNPVPTVTGVSGGTFSNAPSGLSLNSITGEIDLINCLLGAYTVSYTTAGNCQNTNTFSIIITDVDDASFSYGTTNFCVEDLNPNPTISGIMGGTFNSLPIGLTLDINSGLVDISSSNTGIYSVEYTTSGSCPTTSSQVFDLIEVPLTNLALNACDSAAIHGNTYYASQVVLDTLSGLICDSLVNTTLTMSYSTSGTDTQSNWCSYDWIDGITYTESNNTATHILTNSVGCDSLVQLDLTISGVDITVNDLGTIFTANAVNVDYQWLDCNLDNWALIDETNQTFNPTLNGSYAVMITENACTDTSDCFDLFDLSSGDEFQNLNFNIYPNPFFSILTVQNEQASNFEVIITDLGGRIVLNSMYENQTTLDLSLGHLESGVYLIRILSRGKEQVHKVFKH